MPTVISSRNFPGSTAAGLRSLGVLAERALLSDLTIVTIGAAGIILVLVVVVRFMWRRGKHVEEP